MASSCLVFWRKRILVHGDNAPVHRAHTVDNYKDQNDETSMEWPAQSPFRFKHNRKYLALHEERATKVCGKYRYKIDLCVKSRVSGGTSNWII